jgi:hypothetical protein
LSSCCLLLLLSQLSLLPRHTQSCSLPSSSTQPQSSPFEGQTEVLFPLLLLVSCELPYR